jgi:hypothetical protein
LRGAGEAERAPDSPACERFTLMRTIVAYFRAMMPWRQQLCAMTAADLAGQSGRSIYRDLPAGDIRNTLSKAVRKRSGQTQQLLYV